MSASSRRWALLEGIPLVAIVGVAGIVAGAESLAWTALVPVVLGLVAGAIEAGRHIREAREEGANKALAGIRGAFLPVVSTGSAYLRLGLWRGRWVYDAAAAAALVVGGVWWLLHAQNGEGESIARWSCAVPLALAIGGLWLRFRTPRSRPSPLFTDVMLALDSWEHRRRRPDELAYENAIADSLKRLGFNAAQGQPLDDGREADIVVRPERSFGAFTWRDVMIEMKAHMLTTNERDRAMGQLETYASTWPGAIVLMICGDLRRDLLTPLREKVATLRDRGQAVALVVKGRATDGAPQ